MLRTCVNLSIYSTSCFIQNIHTTPIETVDINVFMYRFLIVSLEGQGICFSSNGVPEITKATGYRKGPRP